MDGTLCCLDIMVLVSSVGLVSSGGLARLLAGCGLAAIGWLGIMGLNIGVGGSIPKGKMFNQELMAE